MRTQQGFSIVAAIFILVVLGLLGGYMVSLSAVQMNTASFSLQGARAYQAARAGIEWAIARIGNGGVCSDINAQSAMTFTGINDFTVSLSCSSQAYSEGDQNLVFYSIDALSQAGSYGGNNYVAREIKISIIQ